MIHVINILIDCTAMTPGSCSDTVLAALQHGSNFRLRADNATDTVHGSVSIVHHEPPILHEVTIELYEAAEEPTAYTEHGRLVGRESTLERASDIPSASTLKERLGRAF
jgi:hypothetical protein